MNMPKHMARKAKSRRAESGATVAAGAARATGTGSVAETAVAMAVTPPGD